MNWPHAPQDAELTEEEFTELQLRNSTEVFQSFNTSFVTEHQ